MKLNQKKYLAGALSVGIVLVLVFLISKSVDGTGSQKTITIKRGEVVREVRATGNVAPATTVDLGFEKSGLIKNVFVKEGDAVGVGALLATIEDSVATANLLEGEAELAELKRGARPEEIAVKKSEVAKYSQDLDNAYGGVSDTINDAFAKSDDALHVKTTGIFSGSKSSSYKFTYSVCDSKLDVDGSWARYTTELDIEKWRTEISLVTSSASTTEISAGLENTDKHLEKLKTFLDTINQTLVLDCTITNTSLDTYRANMSTARATVATMISSVNIKKQSIALLGATLKQSENELLLMRAGTSKEKIDAQEARLLGLRSEINRYRIYAPISGIITKVDAKKGSFASETTPLLRIISRNSLQVEADISEVDIADIAIGNPVNITLDAYGENTLFQGTVTKIAPAETIISNIPTYKVTVALLKDDSRIKPGMTANINIITAQKNNVVLVPASAIHEKNNQKFVSVSGSTSTTETMITTGVRGIDGNVEVVSGLSEGATVVVSQKQK